MVREFWLAEKEAEAKKKVDAKRGEDGEKRKLPSKIKLFDQNSLLFGAYLAMEEKFCCKFSVALAMTPGQQPKTNMLSIRLVKLLRWDLPFSKIPYNLYDGSASVLDVAKYLRADKSDIKMAISDGSEKPRLFLFQLGNEGKRKICALGGHGFPVLSPMGNWPISKVSAASYPVLVHETASSEKIKESGFIHGSLWRRKFYRRKPWRVPKSGKLPGKNSSKKLSFGHFPWLGIFQACILLSFPRGRGVGEIKGCEDGEENQKGKKEKKRKLGENLTFGSTKS